MRFDPRSFGKLFLTGLVVLLPVAVTLAFLGWLLRTAESFFGRIIEPLLGSWYFPGMGMALGVVFVTVVGLLAQAYFFRKLIEMSEGLLERIPLVKTVYGGVRDLIGLFHGDGTRRMSKVVRVRLPGTEFHLIGFVTREDFEGLPRGIAGPQQVAVYLPMSYQIGGYTVIMPRDHVEPIDMSFEDAMRYTVTAGLSSTDARPPEPRG
jgi:uncharacterized membrane protein